MFRLYSNTEYGEVCYNILLDKQFDKSKLPALKSILGKENKGVLLTESIFNQNKVIEYGYKVNFESPWSTHIRTILNNSDIKHVARIEKTYRVKKTFWDFKKHEFDCSCGCEMPLTVELNVQRLAEELQYIRNCIQRPITINSGYRCESYNNTIPGSSSRSQHVLGKDTFPNPNSQRPHRGTPSNYLIEKAEKGSP